MKNLKLVSKKWKRKLMKYKSSSDGEIILKKYKLEKGDLFIWESQSLISIILNYINLTLKV